VNRGEIDPHALIEGCPQPGLPNGRLPEDGKGGFALFRIGDAVAGRNIHAAIYDAARLCKDI
jgi:dimethylglycine catabolism A